jgi:cell division septation protein DedD
MAGPKRASRKKKPPVVRLELGWGGIFSLVVVCFCIFLWMFLLGIWTGQTVLVPAEDKVSLSMPRLPDFSPAPAAGGNEEPAPIMTEAAKKATGNEVETFFSLQVAAYSQPAEAGVAAREWRKKGYDAFLREADNPGEQVRLFVGRFAKLADASELAARLERQEKIKPRIALLPTEK